MSSLFPPGLLPGDRLVRFADRKGVVSHGLLALDGGSIRPVDDRGTPGSPVPEADILWCPPVVPGKIIAVGLNDRGHALEMGKKLPEEPLLFLKSPSSLGAHRATVACPAVSSRVDYEGEIGLVIGKPADHIPPSRAREALYGITAVNDITARDLQGRDVQYSRAKSFAGFCPTGPVILVGETPDGRSVRTRVNGELRQDGRETDQIFRWESLISYISHMMRLEPGDLILTGTYRGVGPLAAGDSVTVEVEGLPPLESRMVSDPWPSLFTHWPSG